MYNITCTESFKPKQSEVTHTKHRSEKNASENCLGFPHKIYSHKLKLFLYNLLLNFKTGKLKIRWLYNLKIRHTIRIIQLINQTIEIKQLINQTNNTD